MRSINGERRRFQGEGPGRTNPLVGKKLRVTGMENEGELVTK